MSNNFFNFGNNNNNNLNQNAGNNIQFNPPQNNNLSQLDVEETRETVESKK